MCYCYTIGKFFKIRTYIQDICCYVCFQLVFCKVGLIISFIFVIRASNFKPVEVELDDITLRYGYAAREQNLIRLRRKMTSVGQTS